MRCSVMALLAVLSFAAGASGGELEGRWDLVRVENDEVSPTWIAYHKFIYFTCDHYDYIPEMGAVSQRWPFDVGTYKLDPDQDPKELDFIARTPVRGESIRKGIYELDGD